MPGTAILPRPAPPAYGEASPPASLVSEQQPREDKPAIEEQNKVPVATHTRTNGIIYHPPDIRSVVDKTVRFVAKNGPEFEKRILVNNAGDAKFNFLNPSDPCHAYYQHRLSGARAETQSAAQQPPSQSTDSAALGPEPAAPAADNSEVASKPDPAAQCFFCWDPCIYSHFLLHVFTSDKYLFGMVLQANRGFPQLLRKLEAAHSRSLFSLFAYRSSIFISLEKEISN